MERRVIAFSEGLLRSASICMQHLMRGDLTLCRESWSVGKHSKNYWFKTGTGQSGNRGTCGSLLCNYFFFKVEGRYWQNNQQRQVLGCSNTSGLDAFPGLQREAAERRKGPSPSGMETVWVIWATCPSCEIFESTNILFFSEECSSLFWPNCTH